MTHKQISGHISDDIPPQMKILIFNALLQFCLKSEHCKMHKATWHPTKCGIINEVKLFQQYIAVYTFTNFFTLSNQMSRYKFKCIRMCVLLPVGQVHDIFA